MWKTTSTLPSSEMTGSGTSHVEAPDMASYTPIAPYMLAEAAPWLLASQPDLERMRSMPSTDAGSRPHDVQSSAVPCQFAAPS